jgi:hypothetical protein
MKKIGLLIVLFLSGQIGLYSQTNYIQSTTDASLGNQPLLHNNELKIGNSTSATERAKNMIKIGDGSYIQIGEWEANDLLSFKAGKYNFTNGKVGIGTTSPTANLEISGSLPTFILRGTPSYLQIGVPSADGHFAPYALPGDVVFRAMSGVNGHSGIILNIPNIFADGRSSIRFGDDKNGGWFSLYNNKIVTIDGKVGIGTTSPTVPLEVNGAVKASSLLLTGNLTSHNIIASDYLQIGQETSPFVNSYGKKLYFGISHENTDDMFMARFNVATDKSDLRINLGDNNGNDDRLVVGRTLNNIFSPAFIVSNSGNVYANGIVYANEVKIETGTWADFVFHEGYKLPTLNEVKLHIDKNKHLPGIPTEKEVKENGVNLGEMQTKLLQKIEELTLYLIQQENTIQELKTEIQELKEK